MSMDTIMEDDGDSFVSNTDAIIYAASDNSGWTQSLISDPNIPNSTSGTDDFIVSGASSRIYNVDFMAFSRINDVCDSCNEDKEVEEKASEINNRPKSCAGSELGLGLNIDRTVNNETNINIVNNDNVVESSRVNDYFKSFILDGVEFSSGLWGEIISMETSNSPKSGWQSLLKPKPNHPFDRYLAIFFVSLSCLFRSFDASAGDVDPLYRACILQCEKTGCASSDSQKESLYGQLTQIDCPNDCKYHCMHEREKELAALGFGPVKYHGKWAFKRVFGLQEPVSVAFSALNLAMHFQGWLSFIKLRSKTKSKRISYDYTGLWHIYALLSVNSWFWSVVFHSRDVEFTEKLDYSSAVALLGFSLTISVLRCFSIKDEATRVLVSAPLLAFTTTHILYLNNYQMDYGWNIKVCVTMGVAQLLIWAIWAGISHHPSKWKVWKVVVGGGFAMLLEIYDFPPYAGLIDAHSLWHAITVPLTYIWWSFIQDDTKYQTINPRKKVE